MKTLADSSVPSLVACPAQQFMTATQSERAPIPLRPSRRTCSLRDVGAATPMNVAWKLGQSRKQEQEQAQRQDQDPDPEQVALDRFERHVTVSIMMPVSLSALLSSAFLLSSALAASADKPLKPCTAISPTTQRFFDLNPMHRAPPDDKEGKSKKKAKEGEEGSSWHARGYDYGANFTINFCGPVIEGLGSVVDLDKEERGNVSAFYERDGKTYAIGLESYTPVFRGRKLVLNYTGGSYCPSTTSSSRALHAPVDLREIIGGGGGGDDDDEDDHRDKPSKTPTKKPSSSPKRRKSSIISLLCESDPLAKTSISFVAAVDDCVYFFEGRSPHACGGAHVEKQALSPGGVFGVIMIIAILVYLVGGCVYQRTVMHQRGWRQLPNYQMWASIAQFVADMFIIATSSCARFLPSRRGYSRVSLGQDSRGRNRRNDDEDRLIDNLDEEWDD